MALSIQLATTFDVSTVCFSPLHKNKNGGKAVYINSTGNRKVFLQLPYMRAPFGLSSFTDEATQKTSYSLDLSFDTDDQVIAALESKFKALDDMIIQTVAANSEKWLGKNYNINVIKEALYKPLVRPGKAKYASTMKLKVLTDMKTGDFVPEAYNSARKSVNLDTVEKGQRVMTIIDLNQIWFIDNKFGVSARLQQVLLEPSKKLPTFAFQGMADALTGGDEAEEEEEEEFDDGQ
jgi:hypothetical protein